jgi:hypothetical protein
VELAIYADESGTHSENAEELGSAAAVIAGFVASPAEWEKFCGQWQAILNEPEYHVPYFRFAETGKRKRESKKSFYHGWADAKMEVFLYRLAEVAGRCTRFPVSGQFDMRRYNRLTIKSVKPKDYPYEHVIKKFFQSFLEEVRINMPGSTDTFAFFFDQNTDKRWKHAVLDIHDFFRSQEHRIADLTFRDDKTPLGVPLQSADMLAYRLRQVAERYFKNGRRERMRSIDKMLLRRLPPNSGMEWIPPINQAGEK